MVEAENKVLAIKNKKHGCLMRLLTVALILVCAPAIFIAIWGWHISREREKFSARVRAMVAEYEAEHPEPDPEDNAAPLYDEAYRLCPGPRASMKFNELKELSDGFASAKARKFLSNSALAIKAIRKGVARPRFYLNRDFLSGDDPLASVSLRQMRQLVMLLRIAARNEAASGKPDKGLKTMSLGLPLARHAGESGLFIDFMIMAALEDEVLNGWQGILGSSEPTAEGLRAALAALDEHRAARPGLARALRTEKVFFLWVIDANISGRASEKMSLKTGKLFDKLMVGGWDLSGLAFKDAKLIEEIMDEGAAAAEKPYPQALDELGAVRQKTRAAPRWAIMTLIAVPSVTGIYNSDVETLAKSDAARMALGCRLYRLKHGKYPDKLGELAEDLPEHFKKLPVDPFAGKPFKYQKTGEGCKIWSLGRDRTDDGGKEFDDVVFELKR